MRERSLVGMQQRSIEIFMSALIQLVPLDIAVDIVAEDRSAAILQMHSDLVSSEGRKEDETIARNRIKTINRLTCQFQCESRQR